MQVRYLGLVEKLKELMVDPVYSLNAAVYTELSDVEAEINGLITYDRQVCSHNSLMVTHHPNARSGSLAHTKAVQWCRISAGDALGSVRLPLRWESPALAEQ